MHGFAEDEIRTGVPLLDLFTRRHLANVPTVREIQYCRQLQNSLSPAQEVTGDIMADDGRTIHFISTPLPSGGWLVTHEDTTQQQLARQQIEHLARHDSLTDLINRSALCDQLDEALERRPPSKLIAVLFLDLDNFKTTNDALGHNIGDQLLKEAAERIRHCSRRSHDQIARFGGDDFAIVSTDLSSPAQAAALAERVRQSLRNPFNLQGHLVEIDASIGIALAPQDGLSGEELFKKADLALYQAKRSGRGACTFFENGMDTRMAARRNLEMELRSAFARSEFEVHYQPLLCLATNRITSCEALIRWNHPTRGLVGPSEFISVAEEIGLINNIGDWVMNTACLEAAKWPKEVMVSVNVSAVQFRSRDLINSVISGLTASGLPAGRLELEITESVLLDDTEQTLEILAELQNIGVRIAMDDFGTGYSSLSYLQKHPFNKIKIDQSFVQGLSTSGEANAIVRAVTNLAESLRMDTTAEGVETEGQKAMVTALGCSEIQGFIFSKAVPAMQIRDLLRQHRSHA
ncbi:hypothetical protein MB02_07880 [Croceicoccus estronivorus]|nr:hypothetical protein MB02_07880 [Croceicoccus estronivorus]